MANRIVMDVAGALDILARHGARLRRGLGLTSWTAQDQEIASVVRFRLRGGLARAGVQLIGIIGGASSGKSTVFNNLLGGRQASCVTLLSHTTKGLIAAVPAELEANVSQWLDHDRVLMPALRPSQADPDEGTIGEQNALTVVAAGMPGVRHVLLFDTPDFTTESARREGDLARNLLPWFDRVLVLMNQGRWDDEATFGRLRDELNRLRTPRMILFNFNAGGEPTDDDLGELERRAERFEAAHVVIEFRHGRGFRKFPEDMLAPAVEWMSQEARPGDGGDRAERLLRLLGESAGHALNEDAQRLARLEELQALLAGELEAEAPGADRIIREVVLSAEQRKLLSPVWRSVGRSVDWLREQSRVLAEKLHPLGRVGQRGAGGDETDETDESADPVRRGCTFFTNEVSRLTGHLRHSAETSRFWGEVSRPDHAIEIDATENEAELRDEAFRLSRECAEALAKFEERIRTEAASLRVNVTGLGVGAALGATLGAVLALPTGGLSVPAGVLLGLAIAAPTTGLTARALVRLYHALRGTAESHALWAAVRQYEQGIRRAGEATVVQLVASARARTLSGEPELRAALAVVRDAPPRAVRGVEKPEAGGQG